MNSFKILNILDSHDEKANIDSVNVCGADNLHNLRDDSVITKKDEESEQRTDNSLVIRFGYPFPKAMTKGPFFQHFIDKFASMGVAEYTKMQCKILDEMIGGNSFQVTGSGVTCGAGKTSLTIGATVGLFQHGDKVIIVNKPWTNEALSTEISDLVGEFSGGRARLGYCGQKSDISQVVRKSDVIIATTREIERIADVLINGNVIDESCNVTVVFDEAHTIFNRREYDTFDSYMKGDAQPQKPHMTMVFEALAELFEAQGRNQLRSVKVSILSAVGDVNTAYEEIDDPVYEEIDKAHKELEHGHLGSSATGSVKKTLNKLRKLNPDIDKEVTKIRNFVSLCPYCIEIEQCRLSEKHGSDWERYYEEPKPLPKLKVMVKEENPSDIIEHAFKIHLNVDVTKIISEEFERQVHTYIFDIRRRGCEKIGGVTMYYDRENQPKPLIYETMLGITFNWLVDGRLLFVIRRAQLGAMTQLLDEKLSEDLKNEKTGETLGVRMCEYYTYTADKKLWNVQDSDGRPCFNIVIVCDDELDNLQGINFVGVRAVYLFTLGDMWNMPKKLQALGRAGRLGQGVTYQFVMFDKASNKNAEKERLSSQYFRQLMAERETKQIVTVDSEKILEQSLDGLPDFKPTYKEYFFDDNASKATAQAIKESVRMANLPQVCKHLKPGPSGKPHMCDRALTHKCHWYHPTNSDIYEMKRDKPILLKPNLFWHWYQLYVDDKIEKSEISGIKASLKAKQIGVTDVISECRRKNKSSLDSDLVNRKYNHSFFKQPVLGSKLKILCTSKGVMNEMLLNKSFFSKNKHYKINSKFSDSFQNEFISNIGGETDQLKKPIYRQIEITNAGEIDCLAIPSPGSPYRGLKHFGLKEQKLETYLNEYLKQAFIWLLA